MTREQIAELRRLEREATLPPWLVLPDSLGMFNCVWGGESGIEIVRGGSDQRVPEAEDSDMRLIAAMRGALTRLLDEREALLAALKKVAWGGSFHSETDLCCSCRASRDEDHGPACVVQAAIAKAEAP